MADGSCVGFTDHALDLYRDLEDLDKDELDRGCATVCESCKSTPSTGVGTIPANQWTAKYRCRKEGEKGKYCGFRCTLMIEGFRWDP